MQLLLLCGLIAQSLAVPVPPSYGGGIRPQLKQATYVANVTDPSVSRDSCGSTQIGDRTFWTCRDTMLYDASTEKCTFPMITNTASWTNMSSGGPDIQQGGPAGVGSTGSNSILQMYGGDMSSSMTPYFPVQSDECPSSGVCDDGSRWTVWPDQPPVITSSNADGSAVGYTWIAKAHIKNLTPLNQQPAYGLYKTFFSASEQADALPYASVVDANFWSAGQIGYGDYGGVVKDGVLYLYGQTASSQTALAKVPLASIEDKSTYQYYVSGTWISSPPSISSTTAALPNAGAGGQGTFYFSNHCNAYVWIGQSSMSNSADFYISTAPAPEGPWVEPYLLWKGKNGDHAVAGGYSLQAHPGLGGDERGGVYVTWSQQWDEGTYETGYTTPLVWLEFQ